MWILSLQYQENFLYLQKSQYNVDLYDKDWKQN